MVTQPATESVSGPDPGAPAPTRPGGPQRRRRGRGRGGSERDFELQVKDSGALARRHGIQVAGLSASHSDRPGPHS